MESPTVPQDFPEPTASDAYIIPTLGITRGSFGFSYLSTFLSYITPYDLPVELLRDAFHTRVSFLQLIMEALKVESGYICLIAIFFLISLIPLCYTIAWGCSKTAEDDLNSGPTVDAIIQAEELSLEESLKCRRRVLSLTLQIIILLLIAGVIVMFVTNEQIASAIDQTPLVVRSSLTDVETFLRDAEQQISFVIFEGLSTTVDRIKSDLEDIDKLLGEPIQNQLSLFTGIEIIFEAIMDISTSSNNLSRRIFLLQESLARAAKISYEAEYRLDELQIQLSVLQRQCSYRDRPLCDTLKIKSFEESGQIERLRKIQNDPVLAKLMSMGEAGKNSTMKLLTQELTVARSIFRNYRMELKNSTNVAREHINNHLEELGNATFSSTNALSNTINNLVGEVSKTANFSDSLFDYYRDIGEILWWTGLTATICTLLITFLLLGALSCGCCHSDNKAGITLVVGAVIISMCSIALSGFAMVEMLLGAHGHVFICHPLYDIPDYTVLSKLLDKPGMIYSAEPPNGIIEKLLKVADPNRTLSVNIPLASVINECERNRGAFSTFQLEGLINVSSIMDYNSSPYLDNAIEQLTASEAPFIKFTVHIQAVLEDMLNDSDVNLAAFRTDLTQLSPDKDVVTFIDQLQRVSAQIQDVATSSRMATLGSRAKRLQGSLLHPLEQLRGDIVYHLTALELQIHPWATQLNKSLTHLRNAQSYLDVEAAAVCHNKSDLFRGRLRSHFEAYRNHSSVILSDKCASCRPLFDIFDAARMLFCHHIMDPMNGLWFASFVCLFLWAIATPVSLMMSTTYRRLELLSSKLQHTNSNYYGIVDTNLSDSRVLHHRHLQLQQQQQLPQETSSHWSTQRNADSTLSRMGAQHHHHHQQQIQPQAPPPEPTSHWTIQRNADSTLSGAGASHHHHQQQQQPPPPQPQPHPQEPINHWSTQRSRTVNFATAPDSRSLEENITLDDLDVNQESQDSIQYVDLSFEDT
ncbi:prominin-1 isoform X2 [Topomyia yanbarensis]|uniref:prominin-1 isoform X2 n=1 Tax=Topomyia yanbarensis TaxID=2498891 RepID=UPI00273B35CF|nr:prominin-1 isoform X2 [Topomyia yanbarensis]